jgi:hypothetical protein
LSGDLAGDLAGDLLGVEAAKGVKGSTFPISLVLELPMGPRMARSIFFWANPNFRSAKVLVFLTGVLIGEGFLSFSKGILTINFGVLGGDFLADFFFFFPKGNLTMSFSAFFLSDFIFLRLKRRGGTFLGDFFFGKRSGDTRGDVWSGIWCTGDPGGVGRGTRIRSGGTLFFFWVSHLNK